MHVERVPRGVHESNMHTSCLFYNISIVIIKLFVIELQSCFTEVTTLYYYRGNFAGVSNEMHTDNNNNNNHYVVLPMVVSTTVYRLQLEFMFDKCNRVLMVMSKIALKNKILKTLGVYNNTALLLIILVVNRLTPALPSSAHELP